MIMLSGAIVSSGMPSAFASENSARKARSVKHGMTESEALAIVAARPEVKEFKRGVASGEAKKRGVSAHIVLDRQENGEYVVHVFEEVPDGKDESHTATFNWYHVNKRTRAVTKEF